MLLTSWRWQAMMGIGSVRLCTILVHLRSEEEYYDEMKAAQSAPIECLLAYGYSESEARKLGDRHA